MTLPFRILLFVIIMGMLFVFGDIGKDSMATILADWTTFGLAGMGVWLYCVVMPEIEQAQKELENLKGQLFTDGPRRKP